MGITMVSVMGGAVRMSIELTWTAPGDDGNSGTADAYIIKYNPEPITEIGGGIPIVLTSRGDSARSKLASICLASIVAMRQGDISGDE